MYDLKLYLLIILVICLIPLNVYSATLNTCTIRAGSCNSGETALIHTSDITNAHAELLTQSFYSNVLCCSGSGLTNTASPGYATLFTLFSMNNSHVATDGSYTLFPVYLGTTDSDTVTCSSPKSSCSLAGEKCVITVSGTTNAHVADCTNTPYPNKICCSVGKGGPTSACIDSDFSGTYPSINYNLIGTANNLTNSYTDYCTGSTLTEYYCQSANNPQILSDSTNCQYGCYNNQCNLPCNPAACPGASDYCPGNNPPGCGSTACEFKTPAYWTKNSDGSDKYSSGDITINNTYVYLILNATTPCASESINLTVWHCDQTLQVINSSGAVSCLGGNSAFVSQITPSSMPSSGNLIGIWQTKFINFNSLYSADNSAPQYYFVAHSLDSDNAIISSLLRVNKTTDITIPIGSGNTCHTANQVCNDTNLCSSGYVCLNCERCIASGVGTYKMSIKTLCKDDGSGKFGLYNETITTYNRTTGAEISKITSTNKRCILGQLAVPFFDWINVLFVLILLVGFYFVKIKKKK